MQNFLQVRTCKSYKKDFQKNLLGSKVVRLKYKRDNDVHCHDGFEDGDKLFVVEENSEATVIE